MLTDVEVKRIKFFNLTWPKDAVAPAPVVEVAPVEVTPAPAVEEESPAWTWGAEWDQFTWELGPEPSAIDLTRPTAVEVLPSVDLLTQDAPAGMEWVAISPMVSVLRSTAPDHTTYPSRRTVEPRGRIEKEGHRPGVRYGFTPTLDEQAEACDLLAPPRRPRSGGNHLTDWDVRGIDRQALSANEMIEARGFHPAPGSYDDR